MKRSLPIVLSLLLCHCGTEVGNGVTTRATNTTSGDGKNTETAGSGTAQNDGAAPTSASYSPFSVDFLAACASPFAETIAGTFANTQGVPMFSVAVTAEGKKTVTANSALVYTITPAPSVSPYAIEALSVSPAVTCDSVKTQTLDDGSIQRSATLTSGAIVSWTLQAGTVTQMKLVYSNLSEETWVKSSP